MGDCVTRFGHAEFNAGRGRLSVAGRPVALDRSCAAILTLLLKEVGREVDKDRLLEAGWPSRVVHENSLAKAIGRLRRALGEDGELLETVHGYGYRLAADVHLAVAGADAPGPARRVRRFAFVAAALAPGAIAGLLLVSPSGKTHGAEQPLVRGEPADALGRVLWVDDHPQNNLEERRFLESRRIAVYQVTSSDDALSLLAMYEYRAVISDMNRNGRPLAGLELVRELRRRGDRTPFFLYTIVPSVEQRTRLAQAGGQGAATEPGELYSAILPLFGEQGAEAAE